MGKVGLLRSTLHELLLFFGYMSLRNCEAKQLFRWGKTPILSLLCNLPVAYFSTAYKHILFPTLLLITFKEAENKTLLASEMSPSAIAEFVSSKIDSTTPAQGTDGDLTANQILKKMLGQNHYKQPAAYYYTMQRRFPPPDMREAEEYFREDKKDGG
eukprot:TRINITY_DN25686_c0_g1_i1.p2 TRINITY_DN25686_c0_g1~~TRINITY_DN25686_c0_g1_i1.p2  ORF type:complete len:174 (+),score=54.48 TRINITY_DN25686_c0_g1_i1:53-523(+)